MNQDKLWDYHQNEGLKFACFPRARQRFLLGHLQPGLTLSDVLRLLKPGGPFIGTVPADENLSDSQIFYPYCSKQFHRWEHFQSLSRERLEMLLSSRFGNVQVRRVFLSDWNELNWKGKIVWLIKQSLLCIGVAGSGEGFFFTGVRK